MKGRLSALLLLAACLAGAACGGSKSGEAETAAPAPPLPAMSDVEFAKYTFERLAAGDSEVESMLDWESLVMVGEDVAAQHRKASGEGKQEVRRRFIKGFSEGFKVSGSSARTLVNWREESKDAGRTLVAADSQVTGNTLVFTVVSKDGRQKVSEVTARQKQ